MNVEIGTEAPIFLFWEYLFLNFGILSLQCILVRTGIGQLLKNSYSWEGGGGALPLSPPFFF
jgi:hypothetical protein